MTAYYNEFDAKMAQWLRELIAAGYIAPGDVDDRSITEVTPDDLKGFTQCHFFAGIGGWSLALRQAGWSDDRPAWTGSPPCQPFSAAGRQKGAADERHLWPVYVRLIAQCRPAALFGEQVAAAIGSHWLDAVFADLEEEGYACAATVLPACGVGAPHIRQRLWFVADSDSQSAGRDSGSLPGAQASSGGSGQEAGRGVDGPADGGADGLVGQPASSGRERQRHQPAHGEPVSADASQPGRVDNTQFSRPQGGGEQDTQRPHGWQSGREPGRASGAWTDLEWLPCADGKARPTQPGIFPLAHGIPGRVGLLRGAGNAIVPQIAAQVIGAYLDTRQ